MKNKFRNGNENRNENENEIGFKNENYLKMKNGNELKMKPKNELGMNTDLEMNQIVEMNGKTKTNLINNLKQYHKQGKVISVENWEKQMQNTMAAQEYLIEKIKRESYHVDSNYIPSIKLITDEPAKVILNTLKRDLRNYQEIWGFICQRNTITMRLKSNAEPVIYYFQKYDNLEEILIELVKFCKENNLQVKGIMED
jgi:hypothetical protein